MDKLTCGQCGKAGHQVLCAQCGWENGEYVEDDFEELSQVERIQLLRKLIARDENYSHAMAAE